MKKVILSVLAVMTFGFANAQEGTEGFAKGDLYLTGSLGINSTKMGDAKSDGYNFSPGVGYFLTENIALEGAVSVNKQTMTMDFEGESMEVEAKGFAFSVGGKYYFTPADKFSLFAGLGASYGTSKVGDGETIDLKSFGVALAPGINYFFSKNFAGQASVGVLGYTSSKFDVDGAESTNTFNLSLDMTNVNFALIYKF